MYFLKFLIYFKMFIIVEIFNIFVETDKKNDSGKCDK